MSGNLAIRSTHVYILGFSDGVVKVGRTGNPDQRFSTLKREGEGRGATLTGSWLRGTSTAAKSEDVLRTIGRMFYEFEQGREYFRAEFPEFVAKVDEYAFVWDRVVTESLFDIGRIRSVGGMNVDELAWACAITPKMVRKRIIAGELYPDVRNGITREQAERWMDSLPTEKPMAVAP